jgi:hypothetical protein
VPLFDVIKIFALGPLCNWGTRWEVELAALIGGAVLYAKKRSLPHARTNVKVASQAVMDKGVNLSYFDTIYIGIKTVVQFQNIVQSHHAGSSVRKTAIAEDISHSPSQ